MHKITLKVTKIGTVYCRPEAPTAAITLFALLQLLEMGGNGLHCFPFRHNVLSIFIPI